LPIFIDHPIIPDPKSVRACFKIVAAEVTRLISLHEDAGFPTIFEPRYLGCYSANWFSKRALRVHSRQMSVRKPIQHQTQAVDLRFDPRPDIGGQFEKIGIKITGVNLKRSLHLRASD